MKNLAQSFLTEQDYQRIDKTIKAAEAKTSGEIVCMVRSASYHYPMAKVLGSTTLALPAALLLTPAVGGHLWLGTQNMWLFLGLFALTFAASYLLVMKWATFKRCFISSREIDEEVEEAAVTGFFRHALYKTRDATGVLIYISVFERKVWVLADHGINAKLDAGTWDGVVRIITDGIKSGRPADAICDAVAQVGDLLQAHFPGLAVPGQGVFHLQLCVETKSLFKGMGDEKYQPVKIQGGLGIIGVGQIRVEVNFSVAADGGWAGQTLFLHAAGQDVIFICLDFRWKLNLRSKDIVCAEVQWKQKNSFELK